MASGYTKRGSMKRGASDHDFGTLADLFRLLADEKRLQILMLLSDGERNVGSLCDALSLPQPTVSHHLGLLRMQNLITNRRNGKEVFYGLNGHVNADWVQGFSFVMDRYHVRITGRGVVRLQST